MKVVSYLLSIILLNSCSGQNQTKSTESLPNISITNKNEINFDKGIYRGLLDSEGVLWFSSRGNGVHRFDGESFSNYSINEGLCDNDITSILEDDEGNIWFGTPYGMCRYNKKKFTHITIPFSDTTGYWLDKVYPIVNPNQVMSMLQDRNGDFWIGTNGAGVYKYDGETFTQYLNNVGKKYEDSLQHNIVLSITEDFIGNIWFTSLSHAGLSRYNGKSFTHFKTEEGLSDNFLRVSYCDKDGNIWIGTHGNRKGEVDLFDGNTFKNFNEQNGLCSNNVHSIYQDDNGNMWLGSDRGNLCIYDGTTFKEFTDENERKFKHIECIIGDTNNNIWFGGQSGLWRYDGKILIDMIHENK